MKKSELRVKLDRSREIDIPIDVELSKEWFEAQVSTSNKFSAHALSGAKLDANIRKVGSDFLFEGKLRAKIQVVCSRCLTEVEQEIKPSFNILFISQKFAPSIKKKEETIESDSPDVEIFSGDEVNLENILHEQIVLALPRAPLCHPKCKGICPGCGVDLNVEECKCKKEDIDPRLAPLKKINLDLK